MNRLLSGPSWVRYRVLLDLAGRGASDPEVRAAAAETAADPRVRAMLADVAHWPGTVLNSHRSASQTFHTLEFLSEIGLPEDTPEIAIAVEGILSSMDADGIPRLPMNYPAHFGGPGVELPCWALCDAPTLLLCAIRFGKATDPRIAAGVGSLTALARGNGWPCAVSPELGRFRGPGRKDDPCPYATLIMLRLITAYVEAGSGAVSGATGEGGGNGAGEGGATGAIKVAADGGRVAGAEESAAAGVEALLDCWDNSRDRHPYMFFMGTDFRKLKAPFLWYDLLHVADVLSRYSAARADPRFLGMMEEIRAKARPDGSFLPESVYQPYKAWDFGQKKDGSPWIEFLVERIERRLDAD